MPAHYWGAGQCGRSRTDLKGVGAAVGERTAGSLSAARCHTIGPMPSLVAVVHAASVAPTAAVGLGRPCRVP